MAKDFSAKLIALYKQYGLLIAVKRAVKSVLGKLGYYSEEFFRFEIDLPNELTAKNVDPIYHLQPLTIHDFQNADYLEFDAEKMRDVQRRMKDGAYEAFGYYAADKLVYYFWISYKSIEFPIVLPENTGIELRADEAYLMDGYCSPDHRGKRLHSGMTIFLLNRIRSKGYTKGITFIMADNEAAKISQEKLGFKLAGLLRITKNRNKISVQFNKN
jgi:RimJ/RimL family protein N-acetyltransferase